jgi:hypothetical protein
MTDIIHTIVCFSAGHLMKQHEISLERNFCLFENEDDSAILRNGKISNLFNGILQGVPKEALERIFCRDSHGVRHAQWQCVAGLGVKERRRSEEVGEGSMKSEEGTPPNN